MATTRTRRSPLVVLLGVLALGLLIWTRLRLVSSIPRTVYAEPALRPAPVASVETPATSAPEKPGSNGP